MLAGLVRAPSQLAPTRNFGGAKERSTVVLQAMVDSGKVSAEAAETARNAEYNAEDAARHAARFELLCRDGRR